MKEIDNSFTETAFKVFETGKSSNLKIDTNNDYGKNCFNDKSYNEILSEYKEVVFNSFITTFGLDRIIFSDKDGGNVQTIHNGEAGIYANDIYKDKGERKYNRDDYAPASYMNKRRKEYFENNDKIYDCYTGKEIPKDGRTHLEHIVSAKENHDRTDMRILFEKEEMAKIINQKNNTDYIDGSMNQSKSDKKLKDWENKTSKKDKSKTNAEYYGVDLERANKADDKARKTIDEQVAKRKLEHYANSITEESLKQGHKMAVRQGLGVVFTEVAMVVMDEIPKVIERLKGDFSLEKFFSSIKSVVVSAFNRVKNKLSSILSAMGSGFVSGVANSIVTTVINMFVTTGKNIVRLIRQAMVSITEAVRILFFNKEKRNKKEKIIAAAKVIITGASAVLGVFVEQGLSSILEGSGLAVIPIIGPALIEVIPIFSGTLLTGLVSVTFLYFMDNSEVIKKLINFISKIGEDCFEKSLETIKEANILLDEYIAKLCSIDVEKLRSEVLDIHELNRALAVGDDNLLYEYCDKKNIKLQFKNTEEFVELMLSEEALEI